VRELLMKRAHCKAYTYTVQAGGHMN